MHKIKDITSYLESIAPIALQESYDNAGLITGDPEVEVTGALITLDSTEEVVDEAISKGCNLIIAHHPIIFKGLKQLNGKNYVERTIIKAIKNDIAIYAIHTNLDNVINGVNGKIAEKLGLSNCSILLPKSSTLSKLVTFSPKANTTEVLNALHDAGAGSIGEYDQCSFKTAGEGSFRPSVNANPHIGKSGEVERVNEDRIEVVVPSHAKQRVLSVLLATHPYEEVAYFLTEIDNHDQSIGSGIIGQLDKPMKSSEFLQYLKDRMNLNIIRHTTSVHDSIQKIAICGGAGSFLLSTAIRNKADVFITGDFKYHEFFDAEDHLMIADIGHYESEVFTKELIYDILSEKFTKFALNLSEINTNPISYF